MSRREWPREVRSLPSTLPARLQLYQDWLKHVSVLCVQLSHALASSTPLRASNICE